MDFDPFAQETPQIVCHGSVQYAWNCLLSHVCHANYFSLVWCIGEMNYDCHDCRDNRSWFTVRVVRLSQSNTIVTMVVAIVMQLRFVSCDQKSRFCKSNTICNLRLHIVNYDFFWHLSVFDIRLSRLLRHSYDARRFRKKSGKWISKKYNPYHVYRYINLYVYIYIYVTIYIYMCAFTHIHIHTCIYT